MSVHSTYAAYTILISIIHNYTIQKLLLGRDVISLKLPQLFVSKKVFYKLFNCLKTSPISQSKNPIILMFKQISAPIHQMLKKPII